MSTGLLDKLGIRQRILLLTLLPLLFISLLLGGYFTYTRLHDAEQSLIERGQLLARLIASSSEFGFITNNNELLKSLSKGPLLEQDVADILFLNGKYELILRSDQFNVDLKVSAAQTYQEGEYWYFTQPIVTTGIPFLDNAEFQESEQIVDTVGWVVVILSESRKIKKEEQIFFANSMLLLVGFIFTFFLARRFGKRISLPILELTQVMEKIQAGDYEARITKTYTGEFNSLAFGLNNLADTIHTSIKNQESRVELATRRLQSTLDHLEQQNSALGKARRRADEANKAKDDFLARMSHELRTPLTSVVGFAKLLQQSPCSDEQLENIRIINRTSQMLLSIIDDILDFSKLQQDAISIENIPFNLVEVIYDVLEMQAPQAHEKGLELIANIPDTTFLEVEGDPTRLRQIISNIVSNAVKFTDSGYVEVHLETKPMNTQQSVFTIRIIDSGIGIPQAQLNQLFKAFIQADTSITRRFGGSGLGLVIAKRLTELMGGTLSMSSEQGKGTTLTLVLALKVIPQEEQINTKVEKLQKSVLYYEANTSLSNALKIELEKQIATLVTTNDLTKLLQLTRTYDTIIFGIPANHELQESVLAALPLIESNGTEVIVLSPNCLNLPIMSSNISILNKPVRPHRIYQVLNKAAKLEKIIREERKSEQQIRVVVAEDNEFNSILIKKILDTYNIQTYSASTGLEAIKLVQEHKPDIVLMDAHMPVMDGFEATRQIKTQWPDLPVIALTANIIPREHTALYDAGISKVLLKPINDKELLDTIKRLIPEDVNATAQCPPYPPHTTDILEYGVGHDKVHKELQSLIHKLKQAYELQNITALKEINHQLAGISGLYELPEIECCVAEIQVLLESQIPAWRTIWKYVWRLTRLLKMQNQTENQKER
ncbi:ATP-binding protein [Neptunomonas qingdaonensis]|uniref:histidine kinase n=1 Tax=Neptunomonas qingdaonensis TaxID=1045558 RepID=A0A1I2VBP2_9GAMM|nr:ATP-binding protein [Neptunomonas qingdaonensis]SFG84826.1 two-component system, NarL family, sensor histidine kinase BarA [Neptunomonas qingdaonensis]